MANAVQSPVRYSPSVETIEAGETETGRELVETLKSISEKTYSDSGHAIRSVHAKGHAIITSTLTVLPDLPPVLAQGLFAQPKSYEAILRFSTSPGDILDDKVSTPRGLAIKVIGVEGERLAGSEAHQTQDFLLVNGPAFLTPTAKAFLKNLKLLAATTDRAEGLKKVLSAALRGAETIVEAFGGESATMKGLGGHPLTNPLGETYFTQVPMRYGDYIAKVSLAPASLQLRALKDAPVDLAGKRTRCRSVRGTVFPPINHSGRLCVCGVMPTKCRRTSDHRTMAVRCTSRSRCATWRSGGRLALLARPCQHRLPPRTSRSTRS